MIDWSDYANFTEAEMRCKCGCGRSDMDRRFMARLQQVRQGHGRPMVVTSGFRCLEYDKSIGGAGVHPTGHAADIKVSGENVYHLMGSAYALDMRGIGLKQHGPHAGRFMHLDDLFDLRDRSGQSVRPRVWTYP